MNIPHTPPPNWAYTTKCLTCGRAYYTQYTDDYGYCSEVCERTDWDEDE